MLELISKIDEFVTLHEFMQDEDLDKALARIVQLVTNPRSIPPDKAAAAVIEMQSYAAKFAVMASVYTTIKRGPAGSDAAYKKNVYYTLSDTFDKLAGAAKYLAKNPYG